MISYLVSRTNDKLNRLIWSADASFSLTAALAPPIKHQQREPDDTPVDEAVTVKIRHLINPSTLTKILNTRGVSSWQLSLI